MGIHESYKNDPKIDISIYLAVGGFCSLSRFLVAEKEWLNQFCAHKEATTDKADADQYFLYTKLYL